MTQRCLHHCPGSLRDGVEVLKNSDYFLTTVKGKGQFETSQKLS